MTFDDCRFARQFFAWALDHHRVHWSLYCRLMRSVSQWERRLIGCQEKEGFLTFEAAALVATKMMRREANVLVKPYRCELCGKFHVAHRNTKTIRAKQHYRNAKRREYA